MVLYTLGLLVEPRSGRSTGRSSGVVDVSFVVLSSSDDFVYPGEVVGRMTPLESRFQVLAGEFDHRAYLQGFPDSRRLCSYVNLAAAGSHVSWFSSAFVGPHR